MTRLKKSATLKKVARTKFFDENLPQNGTQMYLYHNIYKTSYNIVTIIMIYKLHDICVFPYIFH